MLKFSTTMARTLPFALLMAVAGLGIAQQVYPTNPLHRSLPIRFVANHAIG